MKKLLLVCAMLCAACARQDGQTGATGATGAVGAVGSTGSQGPAGTNGSTITPVQFCLNPVPSYPSTFPEYGLCINGQIWAVYSLNDGFLTLITNGTYSSDGVNASCTFTVTGCTISNQSN